MVPGRDSDPWSLDIWRDGRWAVSSQRFADPLRRDGPQAVSPLPKSTQSGGPP
jgi:hypothetical protein